MLNNANGCSGTGRTIPFHCDPSNTTDSKIKRGEYNHTIPVDDIYAQLANKQWHDGGIFAEECANTPGMAHIGPYIGTSFVARDMLSIIDALGEDKLQYWGISYGTVLGQTFAGMFPDRVGRILLDSTVRFDDYHSGQWVTVTRDTERTVVNYFAECVKAGPTLCPLANFTGPDTTAEDLHLELAAVIEELLADPIYLPEDLVPAPWYQPGHIPAHAVLKQTIQGLAYSPRQFPDLGQAIDLALRRDWETAFALIRSQYNTTSPEKPWSQGTNAFHGIACGDGVFRASSYPDAFSWTQAQAAAGTFSDGLGAQIWPCAQWKFDAKERYSGPWTNITTSFPILFVNGNHDPITPLSGAYEASANFPGSRVVVQNGHGHAVKNHPSKCTDKVMAEYFNDGKMPEVGKVCETDQSAFGVVEDYLKAINATLGGASGLNKRAFEAPRRLDRLMV
jgi:pimeloyl-ACP methyl ester carboxylesterase